jgi:uncharacterized protein (DUF2342 family)
MEIKTARQLAQQYLGELDGRVSVDGLVRWLAARRITYPAAAQVAQAVNGLQSEKAQHQAPDALVQAVQQGWGPQADAELELAREIAQTDTATFAANRDRFGLAKDTLAFLGGF